MIRNIVRMSAVPASQDVGLLALRVVGVSPLLIRHGFEKVFTFSAMAARFPNPLHIGPVPTLVFAMLSDAICSSLLILGLATRWAALVCFISIFAAWAFVHHFQFFGKGGDHGELIVLYLAIMLCLLLGGGGRYSVDGLLSNSR